MKHQLAGAEQEMTKQQQVYMNNEQRKVQRRKLKWYHDLEQKLQQEVLFYEITIK